MVCGSCGLQGISSPDHLKSFSLLSWADLKVFTASELVTEYFSSAGCRYSSFGGFHAPTDVMESGMSSTGILSSLSFPNQNRGASMVGRFEHLPSVDGFIQLRMCVTGQ